MVIKVDALTQRKLKFDKKNFSLFSFKEPISPVSPKINKGDDYNIIKVKKNDLITLLCPAMSWPTPVYK